MPPCEDSVDFNLINKFEEDVSESKPSAFVFYNDDDEDDDDVFYQKDFDYKPPLTGMFVPPCLEMTTGSSDDKKKSVLVGVDKKNPDLLKFGDSYAVHKDMGITVSSELKPHVRDPSWWFAFDSFGNEDEFDAFPRPRSSGHNVYSPLFRIDYIPPIAGMFVPPYLKAFVEEMTTGSSDDNNKKNSFQVVVGNLPYETRNPDLLQLFQSFGHVISADVAVDQDSGCSARFGFVNFATREAAQSAIERVNGIDYHNFVLRVEWSSPTTT